MPEDGDHLQCSNEKKNALESCRKERRINKGTIEDVVRQNNEGACSSHPWRSTIFIREQPGDTSLIISEGNLNLTRGIISANHQTSVPNPWMQWMHTSSGEAYTVIEGKCFPARLLRTGCRVQSSPMQHRLTWRKPHRSPPIAIPDRYRYKTCIYELAQSAEMRT